MAELKIKLDEKAQGIANMPKLLYSYLKGKYAVAEERQDLQKGILSSVEVVFPDFPKPILEKTCWTIHVEPSRVHNESNQEYRLVLGVHWISEGCSWSRMIEIESQITEEINNHPAHAKCWFSVTSNALFRKDDPILLTATLFKLEAIAAFSKICNDFLSEL